MNRSGTPVVSVVMPAFNRTALLLRAVQSVLDQTLNDFELIIVDDGSREDVARAIAPIESRIRIIRHDLNRGAAAARNTGVAEALGDYVAFIDSDDAWEPRKLERQIAFMSDRDNRWAASCTVYHLHRPGRAAPDIRKPRRMTIEFEDLIEGCRLSAGTTLMVERGHFKTIGPFNENMPRLEDWDWLLRSVAVAPIGIVPTSEAHIYPAEWPSLERVLAATALMRELHSEKISEAGSISARRFRAALAIECAAAAFHDRDFLSTAKWVTTVLGVRPLKLVDLLARLLWAPIAARNSRTN